jgi:hypothetical protein
MIGLQRRAPRDGGEVGQPLAMHLAAAGADVDADAVAAAQRMEVQAWQGQT